MIDDGKPIGVLREGSVVWPVFGRNPRRLLDRLLLVLEQRHVRPTVDPGESSG